jgi:hypothetical protein
MKCVILFSAFLISSTMGFASDIDGISVLTPVPYERSASATQTFKSKLTVGVGDLFNVDVKEEVRKKVEPYKNDLASYFSKSGELENFVNQVSEVGKQRFLANGLSDANLIKFYGFLGDQLIGGIADRILAKEGVKDESRRSLWVNKILTPFRGCIGKAKNSQYDASHCMDALTSSLVPSAGIGIVHELSRSKLSSSLPDSQRGKFNVDQVAFYKACILKTAAKSSDVKNCAIDSMANGVTKVTEPKLTKIIGESASTPAAAKAIKQSVWPGFNKCTNAVNAARGDVSDQFMDCIDDLVKDTGLLVVQDKITTSGAIKNAYSKEEIAKLAGEKKLVFKNCIEEQKKNNVRKDGMLDTSRCENLITNDITYKVVLNTLNDTAKDSFKGDQSQINTISALGKSTLDKCWDNDQAASERENCLRKTILTFSESVARVKLDKAVPNNLSNKSEITSLSLKDFKTCLEKKLPSNISSSNDLSNRTGDCASSLTVKVAQRVATESIKLKAAESKLSPEETQKLLTTQVDQSFMSCIGSKPTDEKIETCSGQLKKNTATLLASKQIRANAEGKMTQPEVEALVNNLVNDKFSTCLGATPSDDKLNECIGKLTKDATRSIVIAYEKKQIKEQLNADFTPDKLKLVEDEFLSCVNKEIKPEVLSKELDECTKKFSIAFAKALGDLKFNSLMTSVLGTEGVNANKADMQDIMSKYNACLEDLNKFSLADGLLDKLNFCTDELQRRGLNLVTSAVNDWMSSEQKDAATLMVKNEFARFLPCLGGLLPSQPFTQKLQANVDSILKPTAMIIAQYIEYNPENAKQNLDQIIKKLSGDLKDVASNPASRKELIDMLYQNGALDQFLKSMVRGQVKDSISKMSEEDMPKNLKDYLANKDTIDKVFATEDGKAIKDMVMEKILKPVLMEQADLKSPLMTAGMDSIKEKVIQTLVYSPHFGDEILKKSIQARLDNENFFIKLAAKVAYGSNSMNWDVVRTTPHGQAAEAYIRENVLIPKMKGQVQTKEEEAKIKDESIRLVKLAVKKS